LVTGEGEIIADEATTAADAGAKGVERLALPPVDIR
jgi:hypothetical protein